jgi:uncharacterized protein involved in exopolysaccharide biosynthesis
MLERPTLKVNLETSRHFGDLRDTSVIPLAEVGQFLQRHRRMLALSVIIPIALALLYCLLAAPVYTARAQLLIDPETPQPMQQIVPNGTGTYDSPQVESQLAVLRSDTIALTVVKERGLLNDPEFGGSATAPADEADRLFRTQRVVGALEAALDVRREGLSYAINIMINSHDADKAALIANSVANAFIRDQLAARANAVRAGSDWLEARIDDIRKQMNASALKVQEFKVKRDYRIAAPTATGEKKDQAEPFEQSIDELEATAATYRRIYESYLQAYTESVQRQSFPISNARIITPATRPMVKSKPKTLLILVLATLIGALAGLGLAFFRDHLAQRHKNNIH